MLPALCLALAAPAASADEEEVDCLGCHDDPSMQSKDGRSVGVNAKALQASAHAKVACLSCHDQPGRYPKAPHFDKVRPVSCAKCHSEAASNFQQGFHGEAVKRGVANAPTSCFSCHRTGKELHAIQPLTKRTAETACRNCHANESKRYDTSVHADAAKSG